MVKQTMMSTSSFDRPHAGLSEELLAQYGDPIIKRVIKRRLCLRLDIERRERSDPDAEDVYQKIILKLVQRLKEEETSPRKIEDLSSFIARIAHHVCTDEIRANYPIWNRNKSCVRDLLRRRHELASWKIENKTLCGFSKWKHTNETEESSAAVDRLEADAEEFGRAKFPGADLSEVPLSTLVTEIFAWINGPVEVNRLVDLLTELQGREDLVKEPLDDDQRSFEIADPSYRVDNELEVREWLAGLWHELAKLPLKQRQTFLLTINDEAGESILRRLLQSRIISLPDLCTALGMNRSEVLALSSEVPMDTESAAEELKATKGSVALWKHRALKKLEPLVRRKI